MKNLKKLSALILVLSGVLLMNSCNEKTEIETLDTIAKTTVSDYMNVINSFLLTTEEDLATVEEDGLKSATTSSCLTVIIHENEDGEFWPRNWTYDYGTENCESALGNQKRGMVHISLSDWWKNEGSFRETTFEDFYINDNKMEGVKTILNTGINENGNLSFTKKVTDAKLTYPDESAISWACEKYSEQIEGETTTLVADDVWSVTGTGSGMNLDEKSYTITITTPLIYKNGCFFPVSGVIEIVTENESTQTVDYGDGECDNIATITDGDVTTTIEL